MYNRLWLVFLVLLANACTTPVEPGKPQIQAAQKPQEAVQLSEQDSIESLVLKKKAELEICFQQEKLQNPAAKGRMLLAFTVGTQGTVSDPRIEYSSFQSPVFEGCVLERVESWTFSVRPTKDLRVRYPFTFQ